MPSFVGRDYYTSQQYFSFYVMKDFHPRAYEIPDPEKESRIQFADQLALFDLQQDQSSGSLIVVARNSPIWQLIDTEDLKDQVGMDQEGGLFNDKFKGFCNSTTDTRNPPFIKTKGTISSKDLWGDHIDTIQKSYTAADEKNNQKKQKEQSFNTPLNFEPTTTRLIVMLVPLLLGQEDDKKDTQGRPIGKGRIKVQIRIETVQNSNYKPITYTDIEGDKNRLYDTAQHVLDAVISHTPLMYRETVDEHNKGQSRLEGYTWQSWYKWIQSKKGFSANVFKGHTESNLASIDVNKEDQFNWSEDEDARIGHNLFKFPVGWRNLGLAYTSEQIAQLVEQGILPNPKNFIDRELVEFKVNKNIEQPKKIEELITSLRELVEQIAENEKLSDQNNAVHRNELEYYYARYKNSNNNQRDRNNLEMGLKIVCDHLRERANELGIEKKSIPADSEIEKAFEVETSSSYGKSSQLMKSQAPAANEKDDTSIQSSFSNAIIEKFAHLYRIAQNQECYINIATGKIYDTEEQVVRSIVEQPDFQAEQQDTEQQDVKFTEQAKQKATATIARLLRTYFKNIQAEVSQQSTEKVIDFPSSYQEQDTVESLPQQPAIPEEAPQDIEDQQRWPLTANVTKRLVYFADQLDKKGYTKQADIIDNFLRTITRSH
jgi:hypothetical protein